MNQARLKSYELNDGKSMLALCVRAYVLADGIFSFFSLNTLFIFFTGNVHSLSLSRRIDARTDNRSYVVDVRHVDFTTGRKLSQSLICPILSAFSYHCRSKDTNCLWLSSLIVSSGVSILFVKITYTSSLIHYDSISHLDRVTRSSDFTVFILVK